MKQTKKAFYQVNEYLSLWKKALDDNVLNENLKQKVKNASPYTKILDLGTGSGTQIRRNIDENLIANNGLIIGVDVNYDGLLSSKHDYELWAKENDYELIFTKCDSAVLNFKVSKNDFSCLIKLYNVSVYDLKSYRSIGQNFDLVNALSLFEHTDIEKSIKVVKNLMNDGAYLYAPINYNGITQVRPLADDLSEQQDNNLMELFNEILINTQNVGGVDYGQSLCGDILPKIAKGLGFTIIGIEDSNWLITNKSSNYQKNAYEMFLNAIKTELISANNNEQLKIKQKLEINCELIESWYRSALKNFKSGVGTFFCTNKDILIQKKLGVINDN